MLNGDPDDIYYMETSAVLKIMENHEKEDVESSPDYFEIMDFMRSLHTHKYSHMLSNASGGLKRYLDSEPMEFDGDIIITDPCYIQRPEGDDWVTCSYGDHLEALGLVRFMSRDTLYGDWSCTVFNSDVNAGAIL